jgi:hypothetical protein
MAMQFPGKFAYLAGLAAALSVPSLTFAQHYTQTNLLTDGAAVNPPPVITTADGDLLNPWGIARSSGGPWWVSDNNSGLSTLYDGTGAKQGLRVVIPPPANGSSPAAPTGIVYNGSPTDFLLPPAAGMHAPVAAHFIFSTEDGTISAWSPASKAGPNAAVLMVDNSDGGEGAVYKGATTGDVNEGDDSPFDASSFKDETIPSGFAPFNVQNIGGSLFVTYAMQDGPRHDDVPGAGLGYVDIYSTSGKLEARLEHGSWLNAPWGVVWAPRDFGEFSNRVLVGNFGSGQIAAYDGFDGKFIGLMKRPSGETLAIDGLWAIAFGNSSDGGAGPFNTLFFTAGINSERDGLFGTLTPVAAELDGDEE